MHKEPERPNNDRINILEERMKCVQYLWPNKKNNTNPATYSKAVTTVKITIEYSGEHHSDKELQVESANSLWQSDGYTDLIIRNYS
jgi:hypothetical protein